MDILELLPQASKARVEKRAITNLKALNEAYEEAGVEGSIIGPGDSFDLRHGEHR